MPQNAIQEQFRVAPCPGAVGVSPQTSQTLRDKRRGCTLGTSREQQDSVCRSAPFHHLAVKVHRLGGSSPERAIGLEFVAKSLASYQMLPVTLSRAEAQKLSKLLQTALAARDAT